MARKLTIFSLLPFPLFIVRHGLLRLAKAEPVSLWGSRANEEGGMWMRVEESAQAHNELNMLSFV